MIAANQKLEHRALSWDHLNTLRNWFHGIQWILLDEFSMVGNTMLKLIHLQLQEAKGNKLPFGGVNIICVGDLYQLQPVMQSYGYFYRIWSISNKFVERIFHFI